MRQFVAFILNILPLSITEWLIHYGPRAQTLRYYLGEGRELVYRSPEALLGNAKFLINKTYRIERFILTEGCYDKETLQVMNEMIPEDGVCIDAGANIGSIAIGMTNAAKKGKVYGFEPGPIIYERLKRNRELNSWVEERMVIINKGLSDKEETLYWQENQDNRGNASFNDSEGEALELVTLDGYFETEGIRLDRLDMIKIDVEGMELNVIKGGWKLISKFKPIIYYESWTGAGEEADNQLKDIERMLSEIGYKFYKYNNGQLLETKFPDLDQNTLAIC